LTAIATGVDGICTVPDHLVEVGELTRHVCAKGAEPTIENLDCRPVVDVNQHEVGL